MQPGWIWPYFEVKLELKGDARDLEMHAFGLRVDPESTTILFDGVVTNLLILDA